MFCHKCGKEINKDFEFCPHCGAEIISKKNNAKDKPKAAAPITKNERTPGQTVANFLYNYRQLFMIGFALLFLFLFFVPFINDTSSNGFQLIANIFSKNFNPDSLIIAIGSLYGFLLLLLVAIVVSNLITFFGKKHPKHDKNLFASVLLILIFTTMLILSTIQIAGFTILVSEIAIAYLCISILPLKLSILNKVMARNVAIPVQEKSENKYSKKDKIAYIVTFSLLVGAMVFCMLAPQIFAPPPNTEIFVIEGDRITSLTEYGRTQTELIIPDGIRQIGGFTNPSLGSAIFGNETLTNVIIPNSVETIDANAFRGATHLITIIIPTSVTTIGSNAFEGWWLTVYAEAESPPPGWVCNWCGASVSVVWNYGGGI